MAMGRVLGCDCLHSFQDEKYGKGQRVHTGMKVTTPGMFGYRCTVCSKVKNTGAPKKGK